jgi:predicted phosphohydrolase
MAKLKLTQLRVSKRPVLKPSQKIEATATWGTYTLIAPDGGADLIVLDQDGVPVKDFGAKGRMHYLDLVTRLVKNEGLDYLSARGHSNSLGIGNLPEHLQPYGAALCGEGGYKLMLPDTGAHHHLKFPRVTVLEGGKYIVFSSGAPSQLIVYQTTNNSGTPQAPQSWRRFDLGSDKQWPEELLKVLPMFYPHSHGMKEIPGTPYFAIAGGNGLIVGEQESTDPGISNAPIQMNWLKKESTHHIRDNFCFDEDTPTEIFYCRSDEPAEIRTLDISGDPSGWSSSSKPIPGEYQDIRGLTLDPSGQFFLFLDGKNRLTVLDKETLREVAKFGGVKYFRFTRHGYLQVILKDGRWCTYHVNFDEVAEGLEAKKVAGAIGTLDVGAYFREAGSTAHRRRQQGGPAANILAAYNNIRQEMEGDFKPEVASAATLADLDLVREALTAAKRDLVGRQLDAGIVEYVMAGVEEAIRDKATTLATPEVQAILGRIRGRLQSLAVTTLAEAREDMIQVQRYSPYVNDALQAEIKTMSEDLHDKATDIFRTQASSIEQHVSQILADTQVELEGFDNKPDFDAWHEFSYPKIKSQLRIIADECPVELPGTRKKVIEGRRNLEKLAQKFERIFQEEYVRIREAARERVEESAKRIESDIKSFIQRMMTQSFGGRIEAEDYARTSAMRLMIAHDITALEKKDTTRAKVLSQLLAVKLANAYGEIERRARIGISPTGHQMVLFGNVQFPRWEGHVKRKKDQRIEVLFDVDLQTRGPGVGPSDLYGDITLKVTSPEGKIKMIRLFEFLENEDNYRLGLQEFGLAQREMNSSYIASSDYKKFKKALKEWAGPFSKLKAELKRLRAERVKHYSTRTRCGSRPSPGDATYDQWKLADEKWQEDYKKLVEEYNDFYKENFIMHLRQLDKLSSVDLVEDTNGKGYVPEWQPHWTSDHQTEKMLGQMARTAKMQIDLQEGLLNLKGHAGTGKDVLVKMFCARTNRPYFAFDCSKWTTEFELSEDIVLESKDGASQTVQVPSVVLNAIRTPGAVMYFNEINAMPEQAQIFLHALMDEKRSLTLKTSGGRTIKAHPSVIFMGSMNPGYPGTFDPQFATRSRMISLEVDYPPFRIPAKPSDHLASDRINSSEPLRVARSVDSLTSLTVDPDPDRNEFVKMWNAHVNGDNQGKKPNTTQEFDLNVILALVTFADKFRTDFVLKFEGGRAARNALPVNQPITLREMRRCAYMLSQMSDIAKTQISAAQVAKDLITEFFLSHIDSKEDRGKLEVALKGFTYRKRIGVT